MEQNENNKNIFGNDIAKLTVQMDIPEPPPFEFISPFKTIEEWLSHLCETNELKVTISECLFELMYLPWGNVLTLEGFNTVNINENTIAHRIDFKPVSNKYFALPKEEFGILSPHQIKERVVNELTRFTKSSKFQNSFLSKVNTIRTNFNDKIWSR